MKFEKVKDSTKIHVAVLDSDFGTDDGIGAGNITFKDVKGLKE